jgi:hypothetical protein
MKLIHCDKCDNVLKLEYHFQICQCGNIGGKYLREDGRTAEIHLKNKESFGTSRVLGFPNSVRYGKVREGNCWNFLWDNEWLIIFVGAIPAKISDLSEIPEPSIR